MNATLETAIEPPRAASGGHASDSGAPAAARPKVSVCTITYNHAHYLEQAIDSVLMQQTTFQVEMVIGEDCSKDQTRQIAQRYASRYPDRIRLITRDKNVGAQANFIETVRACTGAYVALLEGDDYWTDPHKLQRQADFLDFHPQYVGHSFNALIFEHESGDSRPFGLPDARAYGLRDLLSTNYLPTCGVMFRHGLMPDYPEWFKTISAGDWTLHILHARLGDFWYDPVVMGRYRVHPLGAWSAKTAAARLHSDLQVYHLLRGTLGAKWHKDLDRLISHKHFELMLRFEKDGDLAAAREHLRACARAAPVRALWDRPSRVSAAFRLYSPGLHAVMRRLVARR